MKQLHFKLYTMGTVLSEGVGVSSCQGLIKQHWKYAEWGMDGDGGKMSLLLNVTTALMELFYLGENILLLGIDKAALKV